MNRAAVAGRVDTMLRSVEHPGGKVTLQYRDGDLEVLLVEVTSRAAISDASLCGRSAWHLVLEGQALLDVGQSRWELLPDESVRVDGPAGPCRISNLSRDRLRVLSVVAAGNAAEGETL
jgi:mannose-6-phosphate isomerase-like protein (cupin superfamily)